MTTRKINKQWKHRQSKLKGLRNSRDRQESTSDQRKDSEEKAIYYECNKPGHYKNECPKLRRERKPNKVFKANKGLMATCDDSYSEEDDSDEEHAKLALVMETSTSRSVSEDELLLDEESDSDDGDKVLVTRWKN